MCVLAVCYLWTWRYLYRGVVISRCVEVCRHSGVEIEVKVMK